MEIRWHGHACFELSDGDSKVLIDPFLAPNNPKAVASAEDIVGVDHVLVTHGHVDHLADAVAVCQGNDAPAIAMVEVVNWLGEQGVAETIDPNLGGTVRTDWGWVKLVQAFHSSTMPGSADAPFSATSGVAVGQAAGLVVNLGGTTVYHAGDTCLFGDMRLIAERTPIDIAILPIGGHYTMDRHDAVVAAEMTGASTVIPCHYGTFPPIETDAGAFKADVESQTGARCVLIEPGEATNI